MKRKQVLALALAAGAVFLADGCHRTVVVEERTTVVEKHYDDEGEPECVREEAPPPARVEVITERPSATHVWIAGRWIWRGEWIWVGGHWVLAPRREAVWEVAHWQHEPRGWVYVPGHWR